MTNLEQESPRARASMRLVAFFVFLSATLSGCMTQTVTVKTPFDPSTAAYAKVNGTGRIEGQAFMRQVGGAVVTAAGEKVMLLPVVPYTNELVNRGAVSDFSGPGVKIDQIDAALGQYTQITTADATGNFVFENLGPGNYYVATRVRWGSPSRYGVNPQGGDLIQLVYVPKGQTMKIILTH